MAEIEPAKRYRDPKPTRETTVKARLKQSEKGAVAVDHKQRSRLKSFMNGDKNRQLQNTIGAQENKQAKTWVEIGGKMVQVSVSDLNQKNKVHNEPIKTKKSEEFHKNYGLTPQKRKIKRSKR